MAFTVRLRDEGGSIEFINPHRMLRGEDPEGASVALEAAEGALRDGYWVAGYVTYELGAAFVKGPAREANRPLLALGVFDPPLAVSESDRPFALSPLLPLVDEAAYARNVEAIRAQIYDGEVYQVNYTVPFALSVTGDPASLWSAVAETTGASYQAFVQEDEGYVLSWSPELFLAFDGDRIRTKPMKGTAPTEDTQHLLGAKNRAEHIMIVDLLRNDLHRICDDVEVEELCAIERYPRFVTMTSTVAGTLRAKTTLRDTFTATFPCGSITGAPKRAAYAAIADFERTPRGVYCGAIGSLSPQRRGWWNVAIRTAQIDANRNGRFDAGGGIVIDSHALDEWREVALKTAFLTAFSEPVELWETLASDAPPDVVEAHLARLRGSADCFRLTYNAAVLEESLAAAMLGTRSRALVRIRLRSDGTFTISTEPFAALPEVVEICVADARVRSDDPFLRIKSAWRPAANAATGQAVARKCFDALLRNERDELTEGGRTNLFIEVGGQLFTPPLECGLLPGILRSRIVSEGKVQERPLTVHDLSIADAIYVGNSARGLLRARLQ